MKQRYGFTYIELLLSLAIAGVLIAFSLPVLSRVQTKNDLDMATNAYVSSLRRAVILSQSVEGDTSWGVKIASNSITLFRGASFVSRDISYDETHSVPSTIQFSGLTEIVMNKFTGYPINFGSSVLTNTALLSDIKIVTVNARGVVNY